MKQNHKHNLNEGLHRNDLKDFVSEIFTIDQFKSKMGEDADIIVVGFKVKEKYPAIDLMEFVEKAYDFVLDADISSGEEQDGQYQVFVEIERTPNFENQLQEMIDGITDLTDCRHWKFRYQKAPHSVQFSREAVVEHVPMTPIDYDNKMLEVKTQDVQSFFDQGAVEVALESDNKITFKRPFAGDLHAKFCAIGDFENVAKILPGALSLDESSQSQIFFLNKYLGNYDINKIGNKFLIRNGSQAVIIEKDKW